jgi:hypothetical protein
MQEEANKSNKISGGSIPKWLIALLFIFILSIIGLVISLLIGSFIPLWLLVGFSFIYSVEKWFSYVTRKYKGIGKLYRLLLNLCILSVFGLLIWSGIRLFSHQFVHSSLAGSLILLAEFILFIWMWRVVSKNSWRWPSMKLTIFSLICLFIVLAFAGVQPIATYKDTVASNLKSTTQSISAALSKSTSSSESTPTQTKPPPTPPQTITIDNWQIQLISSSWKGSTLNVNLKITNLGPRRNFGFASFIEPGPELAVIDSTNKKIDPWVPQPDFSKGELMTVPPYTKEYYPNESWSGSLKFEMSPYSGQTKLYIGRYSWTQIVPLFSLGSPPK